MRVPATAGIWLRLVRPSTGLPSTFVSSRAGLTANGRQSVPIRAKGSDCNRATRGRAGRGPRWWLKQPRRRNWTRPLGRTYRTIPCVGQRRRRTFKLLPTQICKERSRNGRISFKWINKRNGSHLSAFAAYGGQSRLRSTGAGGSSTGKDSRHASDATGTAGDRGEIRTASEGEEALSLLRPSQRLGILELFAAPRLVS